MTTMPPDSLTLAAGRNRAVLRRDADRIQLLTAPRWLTSTLDVEHEFPITLLPAAQHPLRPLFALAGDIISSGRPVRDYCIEFAQENGDLIAVLVQGRVDGDVLLELEDVSDIVRSRRKAAAIGAFHGLVGQSLAMLEVFHKIATYAPTDAPLIITGETGTGKELVARAIHDRSKRSRGPFVAVNCNALTAELFESELFGHEKGSFTGAMRQHRGRFERANNGTLFLDEIGDMPPFTQAKMLRALEEGVIERVGSEKEETVDVRVVAATNVALEQAVQQRRFRADLYHRLSVLRIHIPALRDRHGDIPLLVDRFLAQFARRYEKPVKRLTPEALATLEQYHWPGNVRELRNVIERLVIESTGELIGARALARWMDEREYLMPGEWNADAMYAPRAPIIAPAAVQPEVATHHAEALQELPRDGNRFWGASQPRVSAPERFSFERFSPPSDEVIEAEIMPQGNAPADPVELTRESIEAAFAQTNGNATRAAARLGVHKATLYRHMKRLGLSLDEMRGETAEEKS